MKNLLDSSEREKTKALFDELAGVAGAPSGGTSPEPKPEPKPPRGNPLARAESNRVPAGSAPGPAPARPPPGTPPAAPSAPAPGKAIGQTTPEAPPATGSPSGQRLGAPPAQKARPPVDLGIPDPSVSAPLSAPAPAAPAQSTPAAAEAPVEAPAEAPVEATVAADELPAKDPPGELLYKGDKLEQALVSMCKRGGFLGAVVADYHGLPVAAFNSPVSIEALAAFTTVLGDALDKAARLLDERNANNISVDINYTDKAVLRRFRVDSETYFLMIISPQEVDERSEVEVSIDQLSRIMAGGH